MDRYELYGWDGDEWFWIDSSDSLIDIAESKSDLELQNEGSRFKIVDTMEDE